MDSDRELVRVQMQSILYDQLSAVINHALPLSLFLSLVCAHVISSSLRSHSSPFILGHEKKKKKAHIPAHSPLSPPASPRCASLVFGSGEGRARTDSRVSRSSPSPISGSTRTFTAAAACEKIYCLLCGKEMNVVLVPF